MEIGVIFLFFLISISILFFEGTNIGKKIMDYLYNKIMK